MSPSPRQRIGRATGTITLGFVVASALLFSLPVAASDYDADGLVDERERALGTGVDDGDTDRDGLSDGLEVLVGWPTGRADASAAILPSDPLTPTLLVEVDCELGFCPNAEVLPLAAESFWAAGVEAFFFVDAPGAWSPDGSDPEPALLASDNAERGDNRFRPYVHVLFADRGVDDEHGVTHFALPGADGSREAPSPARAGALIFSGTIRAQFAEHRTAFASLGISEDQLVARALVHELGHLVGVAHEGPANGGMDWSNVMVASSALGAPEDAPTRWRLQFVHPHPRFSDTSRAQMSFDFKGSVETGASTLDRLFAIVPEAAPAPLGHETLSPIDGLTWETGRGFDLHTGDFVVAHLGARPVTVHLQAAAEADAVVACSLAGHGASHAESAGGSVEVTIAAGESEPLGPVDTRPQVVTNSAGFSRTTVAIRCLDPGTPPATVHLTRVRIIKPEQ